MELPKQRVEKACYSGDGRPNFQQPWLDVENERVLAANGSVAVSVPVVKDDDDVTGPIPIQAIKEARRGRKPALGRRIICREEWAEIPHRRIKVKRWPGVPNSFRFPDIDELVPHQEYPQLQHDLQISVSQLQGLVDGLMGDSEFIKLTTIFGRVDGRAQPILAKPMSTQSDDWFGLIMPAQGEAKFDDIMVPKKLLLEILRTANVFEDRTILRGEIHEIIKKLKRHEGW